MILNDASISFSCLEYSVGHFMPDQSYCK